MTRVLVTTILASVLLISDATAQPQIALSTSVATPGQSVTVTVTGNPGEYFGVIGSAVNSGFSYAGVALGVGPDLVILGQGRLDGTGTATVAIVAPFSGTTLDRYYLQAVTSTSAAFVPPRPSPVRVVRNGDLVLGLPGIDGYELCRRLKQHEQTARTPIVAITGRYFSPADVARARREGCYTVLIKPFVSDDLIAEVRRALDSTGEPIG